MVNPNNPITWQMLADPEVMRNLRDMDGAVSEGAKLAARQNLSASDKQKLAAVENPRYWIERDADIAAAGWSHPKGAPQTLNNPADYQAWLSYDLRERIERGNATEYGWNPGQIFFGIHQRTPIQPAKWLDIARAAIAPPARSYYKKSAFNRNALAPLNGPIPGTRTLKQANESYAAAIATKLPIADVDKLARALNVQPEIFNKENDINRRGIVAAFLAGVATHRGESLPNMQSDAPMGAGSIVSEFFNDVKDFINDGFRAVSAAVGDAARYILSLRGTNGFVKFFFDATGTSLLFSALEQTANAAEAGTFAAFDDKAFLIVAGETFVSAGAVVTALGAVIPGFGIIAMAVGAVSISLGQAILEGQSKRIARGQIKEVTKIGNDIQRQLEAEQLVAEQAAATAKERAENIRRLATGQPDTSNLLPIAAGLTLAALLIFGV